MKKIIDEKKLYETILKEGFSRFGNPTFVELLVIAKSIRQAHGYGEINIVRALNNFCEERNEYFNETLAEPLFRRVARVAIKDPEFRKPNFPIFISTEELAKIRCVKNFSYQKIIFSALIFAKSSGNPQIFSSDNKAIGNIIDISGESCSIHVFISKIARESYLHNIFENVIVKKSDFYAIIESDNNDGDSAISILTLDEYNSSGEIYRQFIGSVLRWCLSCGGEFEMRSGNHRRCEDCSKETLLKKTRKRVKKHRS